MSREAYNLGKHLLYQLQKRLKYIPKRKYIKGLVKHLIKEAGLQDDPRLGYFKLLATCTLLGKESMYSILQRSKHGTKKESRKESRKEGSKKH